MAKFCLHNILLIKVLLISMLIYKANISAFLLNKGPIVVLQGHSPHHHRHVDHFRTKRPLVSSGISDDSEIAEQLAKKDKDLEALIALLQKELLMHSSLKTLSTAKACFEISDRNATIVKSISRSTEQLVDVHPEAKFQIAYCAFEGSSDGDNNSQCATDSTCATLYGWKKTMVRSGKRSKLSKVFHSSPHLHYVPEEVLLPIGCTCMINAFNKNSPTGPIIIE